MAAFLPFAAALLVWQRRSTFTGLVDDVHDTGDARVIRDGGDTERMSLSDLSGVDCRWHSLGGASQRGPPVFHVMLQQTCRFGNDVQFLARMQHSGPSAAAQEAAGERMAADLQRRIDQATAHTGADD